MAILVVNRQMICQRLLGNPDGGGSAAMGADLRQSEYEAVHKENGGNSPVDRISKLSK